MNRVETDSCPDDITIVERKEAQSIQFQWEYVYDSVVLTKIEKGIHTGLALSKYSSLVVSMESFNSAKVACEKALAKVVNLRHRL